MEKKKLKSSIFSIFHNVFYPIIPLTENTILDRSKLKQIADDILKCI